MRYRLTILSVLSVILLSDMVLFPKSRLKVTDVRYSFFILTKNSPGESIKPTGLIYRKNGEVAGKYRLISGSGDEFLCRVSRDLSVIDESCFVNCDSLKILKGSFDREKKRDSLNTENRSEKRTMEISGIKFEKISDRVFLSDKPELLKIIPELTFPGIRKYLEKIDERAEKGYRCNLWSLEDFNNYKEKGRTGEVYLGLVDGRLSMIYWRSGRYDFQMIAENTLQAVRNEIYVLFVLKGGN